MQLKDMARVLAQAYKESQHTHGLHGQDNTMILCVVCIVRLTLAADELFAKFYIRRVLYDTTCAEGQHAAFRTDRNRKNGGTCYTYNRQSKAYPSSNRTWSLPFPVAPCDTASAPTAWAISICRFAMRGRAIEVPSKYTPSYNALALHKASHCQSLLTQCGHSSVTELVHELDIKAPAGCTCLAVAAGDAR